MWNETEILYKMWGFADNSWGISARRPSLTFSFNQSYLTSQMSVFIFILLILHAGFTGMIHFCGIIFLDGETVLTKYIMSGFFGFIWQCHWSALSRKTALTNFNVTSAPWHPIKIFVSWQTHFYDLKVTGLQCKVHNQIVFPLQESLQCSSLSCIGGISILQICKAWEKRAQDTSVQGRKHLASF